MAGPGSAEVCDELGSWFLVKLCLISCPSTPVFQTLVYVYGDMLSNVGAAEKVFCYLDRQPNLPPPGTLAPPTLQGRVEFQDVSFAYPNRPDQPVLKVPDRGHAEGTGALAPCCFRVTRHHGL